LADEAAMKRVAFDVSTSAHLRPLVQERRSVLVADTAKAEGWVRLPGVEHVRSWIGVPLVVGGKTLGAYSIDKVETGFFTAEHVARAEMLAAHGAFAIENARLHEELLRHAAELEARVLDRTHKAVAARADAERANLAKSEFLSRVSHDLRTPLNAILGFGQLLQLDGLDAEQEESVGQIQRAGRHLLELIDEILDISRIETEQLGLASEQVDLVGAIAEAVELISPLAAERSIRLRGLSGRRAPALVVADRQRLLQILLNLLGNAVNYTPSRGHVAVSCRRRGGRLRVGVSDTGPGIAEKDRGRLFEPFERLASSEGTEGTGLGLALVKRLTEAMGGRVGYEAVPAGGSLFWFELPAAGAARRGAGRVS
jgi:signal transduction histidine kinase